MRKSNKIAQRLYEGMGYSVYRRVREYYSDDLADPDPEGGRGEDAWDMRKPLRRDAGREHVREGGEEFEVLPEDVW